MSERKSARSEDILSSTEGGLVEVTSNQQLLILDVEGLGVEREYRPPAS